MKRRVAVFVITRDHATLVDTYGLGVARPSRIERCERSVGSSYEAVRIAAAILVSSDDRTAGVDAAGKSLHRFRHIETRNRPVGRAQKSMVVVVDVLVVT